MLISIAIIGILSTVVFGAFVNQNRQQAVRAAANQLSIDLQKMYTYAQAGRLQNTVLPTGYGVHLVSGDAGYTTFADADVASPPSGLGNGYYDNGAEVVANKTFTSNIQVQSITEAGHAATTPFDMVYSIPGAGLKVKAGGTHTTALNQIMIKIQHTQVATLNACIAITPAVGAVNIVTCP